MQICSRASKDKIMSQTCFSRSQLYVWQRGEQLQRKPRAGQVVDERAVENAAWLVGRFPQLGGRKGQAYLLYHELGYVGMSQYDRIKKQVKRLLVQEVARRELKPPSREFYQHERPEKVGQIWAEDFTEVTVQGQNFKVALVLDAYDGYTLGSGVHSRATATLVAQPIEQALSKTAGRGPERFLLTDNGSQYIGAPHERLLTSAQIVQRRIPTCVPQYNGCAEGGMRQFKSVFYNVWEGRIREGADEEEKLVQRVEAAVKESVLLINEAIPRPSLGGVTPADVHNGVKEVKRKQIREYRERESSRDIPPWNRNYWEVLKAGLKAQEMSDSELLTKLAFFCRRPLRRIARRNRECLG